jgi:protein-disulfide isomerase
LRSARLRERAARPREPARPLDALPASTDASRMRAALALFLLASCGAPASGARGAGTPVVAELPPPPAQPAERREAPPAVARQPNAGRSKVDTSTLTPDELREYDASIAELWAPCDHQAVSIAQCLDEARPCAACEPAAAFLVGQVKAGRSKSDRELAFHARFDASARKSIPLDGSPIVGAPDGSETIVVWADFECPFCAMFDPVIEEVAHRFPKDVRLVLKVYPLKAHAHGDLAARAAIAAGEQGKFLEMAHELYGHQDRLEQRDLEGYAQALHLDLARFRSDMVSARTSDTIARDVRVADALGIEGTPFVFIDGRNVDVAALGQSPVDDLADWVALDLSMR